MLAAVMVGVSVAVAEAVAVGVGVAVFGGWMAIMKPPVSFAPAAVIVWLPVEPDELKNPSAANNSSQLPLICSELY